MLKKFTILNMIILSLVLASSPAKQGITPSPRVIEHTAIMGQDYQQGGLVAKMQRVKAANLELAPRELREDVYMNFPVILGSYRDKNDQDTVVSLLQQELFDGPWPTPTMAEHYLEMSYGQFHLGGDVHGWYELSQNGEFYEGSQSEPYDNGFGDPPGGTGSFLQEALDQADLDIDFAQYDSDGPDGIPNSGDDDGFVDAAFFVHSGRGGEGGGAYIWSHRWVYSGWWGQAYTTNDLSANGGFIRVNDYIMQPAVSTNSGLIEIGVFSHEFGHALGLPDLYDTDYSSGGVGSWCLMASGSWSTPSSPVHFSAWCKEMLGWLRPYQPDDNVSGLEFPAAAAYPFAAKLWTHGQLDYFVGNYSHGQDVGREYYLVENRQRVGTEQHLPGTGLIIWHIDNTRWSNNNEDHRMVDVMAADGYFNGSTPGDAWPGTTNNRNFDFETEPAAIGWNGENTQVAVLNISDDDTLMTADVEVHEVNPHIAISEYMISDDNNDHVYTPGETIEIWLTIQNTGGMAGNLSATLTHAGDAVDVFGDYIEFEAIDFMETLFASDPFEFLISDSLEPQAVIFDITFDSDEMTEPDHHEFTLLLGAPEVALVDDDGVLDLPDDYQSSYTQALLISNTVYAVWDIARDGLPETRWLEQNPKVVWFTGDAEAPLDAQRIELLSSYLDGGGKVILSGKDIAVEDLENEAFLSDYFGARLVNDAVSSAYVYGDASHELMENIDRFSLASSQGADNQDTPDGLTVAEGGESLFIYPFAGPLTAGTSKQTAAFSSIYLGFGLESLAAFTGNGDTTRADILERMLAWLDLSYTSIDPVDPQLASTSEIVAAYPNPFNPEIHFKLSIEAGQQASIEIYDISGAHVTTLDYGANDVIAWQPKSSLAGGVYLARMFINGKPGNSLQKITYLK